MIQKKFLRKISSIILFSFCFTTFFAPFSIAKANNTKTLVITFSTIPTHASVSKATLKYNKNFALSYSFDDGNIRGYDTAFKYMNGGYSDYLGQYFGGLYFTDGTGNNVPFRAGYAFYARNGNYTDIHVNTPSYINWTQLQDAVDNGWNVFNHGYTSTTLLPGDPNNEYYNGDPGGHSVGALDYNYELTQNNVEVASHINLKNNAGIVTGPLNMSHVVLPNGDSNYIQPSFDNRFKGTFAQSNTFVFDGSTVSVPDYINVSNSISDNRLVMYRLFDNEASYISGGLFNYVDQLASTSVGSDKHWAQEFTHQITTSTYSPDWNGGMTWTSWKSLMDHIENNYGRFGNDKAWVAGAEEVYDYMMVKQNSVLSQNLVGNQLTVNIDTSNISNSLTNYALSLLVDSDATISSINYGGDFTYHTDNKSTGLINLDWGSNSYSKNDITRVESLVSSAESSKRKSDIDLARNYAVLLPTGAAKTSFIGRLDAIVVPLRTWYIKIRGGITNVNDCSASSNNDNYVPSIYNWNSFYVGKDSLLCSDLSNLKDSDSQSSTLSLSNTAPFNGGLQSNPTGNNTGIYPDTVLDSSASLYGPSETPAKIKISGLENNKTYNIKLFGYTSASLNESTRDYTDYTIGATTKSLLVSGNITDTVEFMDVLPTNGEIEISVVSKNPNWGYGMLNAMEIKENLLAAPSSLSYTTPNIYTKNSTISSLSPTVTGQGVAYSVSPSLPTGLSLDTSTGIISGTPSEVTGQATYTITASNPGGSTTYGIVITVNDVAPSSLSYTTPNIYTRNSAIASLNPTVTGSNIIYSVSPSLPFGLVLNTSTGVISGNPTSISDAANYTVTATNSGGSKTFDINITVLTNNSGPTTYMKYSTDATPADCSSGTLYSDSLTFPSSTKLYLRVCKVSDNSSVSTFEYITPKSVVVSGGSSSSSGGGSYTPVVKAIVPVLNTPIVSPMPSVISVSTVIPKVSLIQKIKKDLEIGMRNKDIKTLQSFLIDQKKGPYSKSLSSFGSTTYFGKLTKQALSEWQKAYKIYPANGYFGTKTRSKIKSLNL
ncbi:MAG: putative Ig domain-containing protein [Candidatus Nomurabacteria bacterium]